MGKYIFLSDIDGTLLRGDSGISQEVVDAAHKYECRRLVKPLYRACARFCRVGS